MEDYFAAKAQLFDGRAAARGRLRRRRAGAGCAARRRSPYRRPATPAADWRAADVARRRPTAASASPRSARTARWPAGCGCPGRFNVANALLALALLAAVGVPRRGRGGRASRDARVPGRMERVDAGQPFLAVVDYAHKPAAVAALLAALRAQVAGGG